MKKKIELEPSIYALTCRGRAIDSGDQLRLRGNALRRYVGALIAASIVATVIPVAPASAAHISPEYFVDPSATGQRIGHRHHLTLVGVRNTGDTDNICVGALLDSDAFAVVSCPALANQETYSWGFDGGTWLRGYTSTSAFQNYRAREVF